MTLLPAQVFDVRELLRRGVPRRQVARQTGVGLTTIGQIATDRYAPSGSRSRADGEAYRECEPRRCPRGHLVTLWPCVTCDIEVFAAMARSRRQSGEPVEPLGLELRGQDRARYEQIRQGRHADTPHAPLPTPHAKRAEGRP